MRLKPLGITVSFALALACAPPTRNDAHLVQESEQPQEAVHQPQVRSDSLDQSRALLLQDVSTSMDGVVARVKAEEISHLLDSLSANGGEFAFGVFGTGAPPLARVRYRPPARPDTPGSGNIFERADRERAHKEALALHEASVGDYQAKSAEDSSRFLESIAPMLARSEPHTDLQSALQRAAVFLSEPAPSGTRKTLIVISDFQSTSRDGAYELPDDIRFLAVTNSPEALAEALGPKTLERVELFESPNAALTAAKEGRP